MDLKLRCSASGCECTNFTAASSKCQLRTCDGCNHSWITHLLEKLLTSRDDALSIFDVCSLALYGTQALPIKLKIVIERLLSTLSPDDINKILRNFGWQPNDLARGYMIHDSRGVQLTRWSMLPREEEILILQQFLRFPVTRSLSFVLLRDDFPNNHIINQSLGDESISSNHTPPQASIVKSPKPSSTTTTTPIVELTQNKIISSSSDSSSHEDVTDPVDLSSKKSSSNHHHHHHHHHHHSSSRDRDRDRDNRENNTRDRGRDRELTNTTLNNSINSSNSPINNNNSNNRERDRDSRDRDNNSSNNNNSISASNNNHTSNHNLLLNNSNSNSNTSDTHAKTIIGQGGHNKKPLVTQGNGSHNSVGNPLKRQQQWTSIPSPATATQLVNPTTGKRRVQCSVCLKTFCDKGALKIHFSAVHLREMHKCTVAGCNMMFSSRRSRNRHSANPNPKLHSPHLRRKISPHDGRTCQPQPIHPILFNPLNFNNTQSHASHIKRESNNNSNSSCYDDEDDDEHEEEEAEEYNHKLPDSKKDGARKRKLKNPVRLPSVTMDDYSGDDFCCYDDGTEVNMSKTGSEDELIQDHLGRISKLPIFSEAEENNEGNGGEPKALVKRERDMKGLLGGDGESIGVLGLRGGSAGDGGVDRDDFDEMDDDDDDDEEDGENGIRSNGSSPNSNGDQIPIDSQNPRKCMYNGCGRSFSNQFGLKTHYNNVHLKLMHMCNVEGCNAKFPSKRSRDRHSANLNLHRKLLSTSDVSQSPSPDIKASSGPPQPPHNIFNPFFFNNGSSTAPSVLLPSSSDISNQSSPEFSKQSLIFNPYFFNWAGSATTAAVQSAAAGVISAGSQPLHPHKETSLNRGGIYTTKQLQSTEQAYFAHLLGSLLEPGITPSGEKFDALQVNATQSSPKESPPLLSSRTAANGKLEKGEILAQHHHSHPRHHLPPLFRTINSIGTNQ